MSIELSIVLGVKNDSYGGNYKERVSIALKRNIENFKLACTCTYEFVVVDWCSDVAFRHITPEMSALMEDPSVQYYHVDKSVAVQDGLNPDIYYEYFAKNVGIRKARGRHLLITNSDIFLSVEGIKQMMELIQQGLDLTYVRPPFRYLLDKDGVTELPRMDLGLSGPMVNASGDFVLCVTQDAIERGHGFDEVSPDHRKLRQYHMDSEFVTNMCAHGMRPKKAEIQYYHIEHDRRFDDIDAIWNSCIYTNRPNWGYVTYPVKTFDSPANHHVIYAEGTSVHEDKEGTGQGILGQPPL